MRIIASLVMKNEERRYLQSCLAWNQRWWDSLFVYDDGSTDDSIQVAREFEATVRSRPDGEPSFLTNESQFRQAAWSTMVSAMKLEEGDWVLSIDADEFVVMENGTGVRAELERMIEIADKQDVNSVLIPIPEIWGHEDGVLMKRVDGFWDQMALPRLTRFVEGDYMFRQKNMGCGSTPLYSSKHPVRQVDNLRILHVGYFDMIDRVEKFKRYTSLVDHGHNPKHIKSITSGFDLEPWEGQMPNIWRGWSRDE